MISDRLPELVGQMKRFRGENLVVFVDSRPEIEAGRDGVGLSGEFPKVIVFNVHLG
jgi:hypothetical protein